MPGSSDHLDPEDSEGAASTGTVPTQSVVLELLSWGLLCPEWNIQARLIGDTLPLIHKVQKGLPDFLRCFSERALGVAGSNHSPRLGQYFMPEGSYRCH